jgi:hypothetical protein
MFMQLKIIFTGTIILLRDGLQVTAIKKAMAKCRVFVKHAWGLFLT